MFNPSSCPSSDVLSAYVAGKLSRAEKRAVEEHLTECEMCNDELEGLLLINPPEKADAIVAEINAEIDKRLAPGKEKSFPFFFRIAASIVLLGGLAFLLVYQLPNKRENAILSDNTDKAHTTEALKDSGIKEAPGLTAPVEAEEETPPAAIKNVPKGSVDQNKNTTSSAGRKIAGDYDFLIVEDVAENIESDDVPATGYFSEPVAAEKVQEMANIIEDEKKSETPVTKTESTIVDAVTISETRASGKISRNYRRAEKDKEAKALSADSEKPAAPAQGEAAEIQTYTATGGMVGGSGFNTAVEKAQIEAYGEAVILFESTGGESIMTVNQRYYYALSLFKTNQVAKASRIFKKLEQEKPAELFNEIQWYYALTLISLDKKTDAAKVLNAIKDSNSPYAIEAIKKLEQLK